MCYAAVLLVQNRSALRTVSTTAALRVAIDIETPIVFLYLSQRAAQHYRSLSLTIAAQRSRSGNT